MNTKLSSKRRPWPNLIWQPILAVIFICVVLFVMNNLARTTLLWAVGAGALSSSSFIVFGKPSLRSAMPLKIIGGYMVGIFCGVILHLLYIQFHIFEAGFIQTSNYHVLGMFAALATGLCLFFMSLLRVEHPPAAGMALVLVIDLQDYDIVLVVIVAALVLGLLRQLLCKKLVDLA